MGRHDRRIARDFIWGKSSFGAGWKPQASSSLEAPCFLPSEPPFPENTYTLSASGYQRSKPSLSLFSTFSLPLLLPFPTHTHKHTQNHGQKQITQITSGAGGKVCSIFSPSKFSRPKLYTHGLHGYKQEKIEKVIVILILTAVDLSPLEWFLNYCKWCGTNAEQQNLERKGEKWLQLLK